MEMCQCENGRCNLGHMEKNAMCSNEASTIVGCQYIGYICTPCAEYMATEYLFIRQDRKVKTD